MKKYIYYLVAGFGLAGMFASCDSDLWKLEDDSKGVFVPAEFEPIASMLEHSGEYDEWVKVLNYSECYSVLNSMYSGENKMHSFTHFAPTNDAVLAFYASKQVSGIEDLGVEYAKAMVRTLTYDKDSLKLSEKFTSEDENFTWESEAGEYIVAKIDNQQGGFGLRNLSGKSWVHVERNYEKCTNGFVYKMEGVLTPLVESVFVRICEEGTSSIMVDALKATGYDKELNTIADTTYVLGARKVVPRLYTFLNVSNAVFETSGIHSLEDLKKAVVERSEDKALGADSLLKRYVQYHIFEADLSTRALLQMNGDTVSIRETMAKNQIMMVSRSFRYIVEDTLSNGAIRKDTLYTLLFNTDDIPNQAIDTLSCDVLAKNGRVHELTGWMPVFEPKQAVVVWDLANYREVRELLGESFQPQTAVSSEDKRTVSSLPCYKVESGPDKSLNTQYGALSYVTCKSAVNCLYNDRLVFNLGYQGSVTMSTPTLAKGKYRVSISMCYLPELAFIRTMNGCKGGMMRITIDGDTSVVSAPYTSIPKAVVGKYSATLFEEVEFTETRRHEFKFLMMDPAASTNSKFSLHFDAITFTPIE